MSKKAPSGFMLGQHDAWPQDEYGRLIIDGHTLPELAPEPPLSRDANINRLYTKLGFKVHSVVHVFPEDSLSFQAKRKAIGEMLDFVERTFHVPIDEELMGAIVFVLQSMEVEGDAVKVSGVIPLALLTGGVHNFLYNFTIPFDDRIFSSIAGREFLAVQADIDEVRGGVGEELDVLTEAIFAGKCELPGVQVGRKNVNLFYLHDGDDVDSPQLRADFSLLIDPICDRLDIAGKTIFEVGGVLMHAIAKIFNPGEYDYDDFVEEFVLALSEMLCEKGYVTIIGVNLLPSELAGYPANCVFEIDLGESDELLDRRD